MTYSVFGQQSTNPWASLSSYGTQPTAQIIDPAAPHTSLFAAPTTTGSLGLPVGDVAQKVTEPGMFSQDGIGTFGLKLATGLGGLYLGMKNYGLMKDQLDFAKDQFNNNWLAQAKTYNTRLEDRQRARYQSNQSAYVSPSEYMDKNRINEKPVY